MQKLKTHDLNVRMEGRILLYRESVFKGRFYKETNLVVRASSKGRTPKALVLIFVPIICTKTILIVAMQRK